MVMMKSWFYRKNESILTVPIILTILIVLALLALLIIPIFLIFLIFPNNLIVLIFPLILLYFNTKCKGSPILYSDFSVKAT